MCRIFSFSSSSKISKQDILIGRKGTNLLKHRGPNGFEEINSYLRNVISKKNSGYDQFAITLICMDHFLKFIDEN